MGAESCKIFLTGEGGYLLFTCADTQSSKKTQNSGITISFDFSLSGCLFRVTLRLG